ncbi:ribosome biogenesis GTP-binding protein YihA/YsxC [uncultured Ferrimonas sp.]|uniref:ribosome biogenesis GTP-binding protein YihA/YsxC n=1 Tax=uncultured Ferrimonas sp. TaxID=432640 RepID=UPI00260B3443|nr:ribosome biogenesis GTP-binding protein YihA/YsxC [uncultured Ferrimonas sp.]
MTDQIVDFRRASFVTSAPDITHLPEDVGMEIAFAGRSNAGKSSALNTLTDHKGLAHTSKTPGRTQLINVFRLDDERRLIDLPGYGFAKVPLEMKLQWQEKLAQYLEERQCLRGLVVMMDVRHPLKDLDSNMIAWGVAAEMPVLVLLTKADKLKQSEKNKVLKKVKENLSELGGEITVQLFSSLKGTGREPALRVLNGWFQRHSDIEAGLAE